MPIPPGMPARPGVYFDWREFVVTSRRGIDNSLPAWAYPRILALVQHVLDPVRTHIGRPLRITSGFRSAALNEAIGGAKGSQHMKGEAVDVKAGDLAGERLAIEFLRAGVPYDQLIWYDAALGGHVHVSLAFQGPQRGERWHAYVKSDGSKGFRPWNPEIA